ncbi:MAG: hypothetical protein D6713_01355 [Deltaproteobacteria bacterium]|nr:MAG: hypothetical protein D6713_01355 [Deltaproteobacteria bacterium]
MDLREAFKVAIKGEVEGRELYRSAAEFTEDEKAKKVFSHLADEEQLHLETLQRIGEKYFNEGVLEIPEVKPMVSFDDAESPIFTREFREFVRDRHREISALSIGMKLELESARFYREMAKSAKEEELKKFLNFLGDWEESHYNALKKQMEFLEEYYVLKNSLYRF